MFHPLLWLEMGFDTLCNKAHHPGYYLEQSHETPQWKRPVPGLYILGYLDVFLLHPLHTLALEKTQENLELKPATSCEPGATAVGILSSDQSSFPVKIFTRHALSTYHHRKINLKTKHLLQTEFNCFNWTRIFNWKRSYLYTSFIGPSYSSFRGEVLRKSIRSPYQVHSFYGFHMYLVRTCYWFPAKELLIQYA